MVQDAFSRPMKDLRISVTDRCNFRCPYCMPAEVDGGHYTFVPRAELLTFEEIARLTRIFVGLGVTKVRLTGGEPLLRNNLERLVAMLSRIQGLQDIALTTNGYLLAQKAQFLKDAGLERVTVSLDSLDDEVFARMNGRGFGTERILRGIEKAAEVGLQPIKINCVVQKGVNEHTIVDLARFCKERGYILRFIEYMDVGNVNGWRLDHVVPADEIVQRIHTELPLEPMERSYTSEVALRYRYVDGGGEIGIIASVTKPFCGDCARVRLSTDGRLFTCLFASQGADLRGPMRAGATDQELRELITKAWGSRTDRYSELRTSLTEKPRKVEMYKIGG